MDFPGVQIFSSCVSHKFFSNLYFCIQCESYQHLYSFSCDFLITCTDSKTRVGSFIINFQIKNLNNKNSWKIQAFREKIIKIHSNIRFYKKKNYHAHACTNVNHKKLLNQIHQKKKQRNKKKVKIVHGGDVEHMWGGESNNIWGEHW